jgi:magnesium-transporting ATPase (P-type)
MTAWHAEEASAVMSRFDAERRRGLSSTEAQERLDFCGRNSLAAAPRLAVWRRFLRQFHNVLIYALLAIAMRPAEPDQQGEARQRRWR